MINMRRNNLCLIGRMILLFDFYYQSYAPITLLKIDSISLRKKLNKVYQNLHELFCLFLP